ncbi:MAG: oligosaccharide flippase family protein [Acidobacteriia bacterium]|nr:oligosaccharide flippase family protein [Terriglobia bacterium]
MCLDRSPDGDREIRPLSLRRNFSWTLAGNLVYAGCQWGMLVVLAKLVSPEDVGQFALGLAVTAPVFMFTNLQLRAVQATDAAEEFLFGDYVGLRLVLTGVALLAVIAIALASGYRIGTAAVLISMGIAKAFESVSDVLYGLMQHRERMDRIAVSMMIKGTVSVTVLAVATYLSRSVFVGVIALAVSWAAVLAAYDVPNAIWILRSAPNGAHGPGVRWDPSTLRRLALTALPLGFVTMLVSLNANIPRYFIEHLLGEKQLAYYAAMAYLLVAGNTIVAAMAQSTSPRMARCYATGDRDSLRRLVNRQVVVCLALGGGGIVVAIFGGTWILRILYRPEYAAYPRVFTILMAAAAIVYVGSVLGGAVTATRWFRGQSYVHLASLVVVLASNYAMIPILGLEGAAWALVLVSLFATLAYALIFMGRLTRGAGSSRAVPSSDAA